MRKAVDGGGLSVQPKVKRDLFVALVDHNHSHFAIRTYKRSGKQLASARSARDSLSARTQELCKMPNIEVRVGIDQFACSCIGVNWRETEIFHVIWSAGFIEQNVPICPANRTVVKVIDH